MRQIANDVADKVLATDDSADRQAILANYSAMRRDTTFATQLLYRLRDGSQNAGKALEWLESELKSRAPTPRRSSSASIRRCPAAMSPPATSSAACGSINDVDWTVWFEDVSRIDTVLRERTDFAALDFFSRDQYRTAIEELARRSELANTASPKRRSNSAGRMRAGANRRRSMPASSAPPAHRCRLLPGRAAPARAGTAIGYRPTFSQTVKRTFQGTGWSGIVVPVFALTALLLVSPAVALGQCSACRPRIA